MNATQAILRRLRETPETLSDEEVRKTSLSTFSAGLGEFPPKRIINAYLWWLEVQRKAPRGTINLVWSSVVTDWVQSLKARDFHLVEIIYEVNDWKIKNAPFYEPITEDGESRRPPTATQLAIAWGFPSTTLQLTHFVTPQDSASTPPMMPKCYDAQHEWKLDKPLTDVHPTRNHNVSGYKATRDSTSSSPVRFRNCGDQLEQKLGHPLTIVPASYICNRCKGRGE